MYSAQFNAAGSCVTRKTALTAINFRAPSVGLTDVTAGFGLLTAMWKSSARYVNLKLSADIVRNRDVESKRRRCPAFLLMMHGGWLHHADVRLDLVPAPGSPIRGFYG